MTRFVRQLFGSPRRPIRKAPRARLGVEALERRDVPASIVLSGTTLVLTGSNLADTASISLSGSTLTASLTGVASRSFSASAVRQITFFGLDGNDRFTNSTTLSCTAWGGRDNDTLYGGSAADDLRGESGNDWLYGMGSADRLDGGLGVDQLDGGAGNDTVYGGAGNDTLRGGADNDYLDGGDNDDQLNGDAGNDQLIGGMDCDRLFGNVGDDTLHGGDGNDWLEAGSASEYVTGGSGWDWNPHQPVVAGIRAEDVKQAQSPTCVFLSALAGAAAQGMNLSGRIQYLGNYRFLVDLYNWDTRSQQNETVTFDGTFDYKDGPDRLYEGGDTYDPAPVVDGEFWTMLYQRAYLQMMRRMDEAFSDPEFAMYALTGRAVADLDEDDIAPSRVRDYLAAGRLLTAGHADDTALIEDHHSYTVLDVYQVYGGAWWVRLRNPWGSDSNGITSGANDGIITMSWHDFVEVHDFDRLSLS